MILLVFHILILSIVNLYAQECDHPTSGVSIAVSPLLGADELKFIEVFWWGQTNYTDSDLIVISDHDPFIDEKNLLQSSREQFPAYEAVYGRLLSSVSFNFSEVPSDVNDIPSDNCAPYYVTYMRNEEILMTDCLKFQPNWMNDLKDTIQNVELTSVVIPGTHDAGAGTPYENWANDGFISDTVAEWTFTQDTDLWTQLMFGIRYFDMRISYYPNSDYLFYVNHGDVRIAPLIPYLEDLKRFLESTNEIVIFDIHSLEHNFEDYPEASTGLDSLITSYVGSFMLNRSYEPNPPLFEIWNSGKRLIVTYPSSTKPSDLYWDSAYHLYADTNDIDYLLQYFDERIPENADRTSLWSCQTELTETALDVVNNRWGGLTGAANVSNIPVSHWFRENWWGDVNIISMDFFLFSDVVKTAIESNILKQTCPNSSNKF